jgi:hypothetical protein
MKAVRWEDTKRQVRELNPDWDTPERTAARGGAAPRAAIVGPCRVSARLRGRDPYVLERAASPSDTSAAQRAVALTRQLLIFGRRDLVHDEVVDINKVIADSERLLRSAVGEHIEFRAELAASAPQVRMDTSHLEQVLLNLSVNARDAMPDGGSLLIATAQCRFTDEEGHGTAPGPGPYVCLSVSDTGTGFTLWYPATPEDGRRAPYMTPAESGLQLTSRGITGVPPNVLSTVRTNAISDATPAGRQRAPIPGPRPVPAGPLPGQAILLHPGKRSRHPSYPVA